MRLFELITEADYKGFITDPEERGRITDLKRLLYSHEFGDKGPGWIRSLQSNGNQKQKSKSQQKFFDRMVDADGVIKPRIGPQIEQEALSSNERGYNDAINGKARNIEPEDINNEEYIHGWYQGENIRRFGRS